MECVEINVADRLRSCLVHRPQHCSGSGPYSLVIAFHGGGINAQSMADFCGLSEFADQAGFLVAYPNGTGRVDHARSWNAGTCCGHAHRYAVDDVAFIDRLLDELLHRYPVDPDKIFLTGMSNGAMLTYLLADRLSHRIAAIAPVGGQMGVAECAPQRPVSVLHFHGTADEFTPVNGGRGPRSPSQTVFLPVQAGIDAWVRVNDCPRLPLSREFQDAAGFRVTWDVYGPGREGTEVQLYLIHGGGHTWPGRIPRLDLLGASTRSLQANETMWEFFQQHPRGRLS